MKETEEERKINKPMANKKGITLTAMFIQDQEDGRFGAFFLEIPGATAQGETQQEAEDNLFRILPMLLKVKNKANKEDTLIEGLAQSTTTRSYNFETV